MKFAILVSHERYTDFEYELKEVEDVKVRLVKKREEEK